MAPRKVRSVILLVEGGTKLEERWSAVGKGSHGWLWGKPTAKWDGKTGA